MITVKCDEVDVRSFGIEGVIDVNTAKTEEFVCSGILGARAVQQPPSVLVLAVDVASKLLSHLDFTCNLGRQP